MKLKLKCFRVIDFTSLKGRICVLMMELLVGKHTLCVYFILANLLTGGQVLFVKFIKKLHLQYCA